MYSFKPVKLIAEVKKRPALYKNEGPLDREERLDLWKEVGAAIFKDWMNCDKATAYDRVLVLQKKWRSLRDAYNRELRARRTGVRVHRRVYLYFKRMSFLGGYDGNISDEEESEDSDPSSDSIENKTDDNDPLGSEAVQKERRRKKRITVESTNSNAAPDESVASMLPNETIEETDTDSDKLFLLSFLPEMKQLPSNIKMWTRAQIAHVMQEAIACLYNNTQPGTSKGCNSRLVTDNNCI